LVATGRRAGGGEAGRSKVVGVEGDGGAEQRKQGRRGTWLRGVLELPRAVLRLREVGGELAVDLRVFFFPPPPSSSPAGRGEAERGGLPVAARVGSFPEARRRPSYRARQGAGRVDGADGPGGARTAARRGAVRKAAAPTVKGKKKRVTGGRRGDVGGDVTRVPPGGDSARVR
jgi:hypothetical protein